MPPRWASCGRGGRAPSLWLWSPQHAVQVQSDGQHRPAQALLPSDGPAPLLWPGHPPGAGGGVRGGAARRAPFTQVVGYPTPTAAFAGEVDTLLDQATYGSHCVSLARAALSS